MPNCRSSGLVHSFFRASVLVLIQFQNTCESEGLPSLMNMRYRYGVSHEGVVVLI